MLKFTKYGRKSCTGSFTVNSSFTGTDANPASKVTSPASDEHPILIGGEPGADGVDSLIRLSNYRSFSGKDDDGGSGGVGGTTKMKEPGIHYGRHGAEGMTGWGGSKEVSASHDYGSSDISSSSSSETGSGSITPDHPPTRPEVHLRISKISPEELRRLDYEIKPGQEHQQGKQPPGSKSVSFGGSKLDLFKMKKRRSLKSPSTVSVMEDSVGRVRVPVFNDGYFPKVQPLSKIFARKRPTC